MQFSVRTTNLVPWWRAFMRLAGFRAEKLCKVRAGGVRRAQVCCEDPHKHTGARVATTCIGVALPLPCQTGKRQKGVGRHQALVHVGDGCLFGMITASRGSNSGTSLFVGVLDRNRLAPGEQPQHALCTTFPHESLRGACKLATKGPRWWCEWRIAPQGWLGWSPTSCVLQFPWLHQHAWSSASNAWVQPLATRGQRGAFYDGCMRLACSRVRKRFH